MYVYKYSVDIYLLCMIKVGLGGVDRSVVLSPPFPPFYFVFENFNLLMYKQFFSQGMSSLA